MLVDQAFDLGLHTESQRQQMKDAGMGLADKARTYEQIMTIFTACCC